MYETLLRLPFLRLIIPCIAGIILSYYVDTSYLYPVVFVLGLISFIVFYLLKKQFPYRHLSGIGINCLLFSFFCAFTQQSLEKTEWNYPPQTYNYKIKILEDPVLKPRTYMYSIQISSIETGNNERIIDKKAILYLLKDSLSGQLTAGNCLCVKTIFRKQDFSTDKSSSQYANYLKNHGYACIGYAAASNWKLIAAPKSCIPDIKSNALSCRRYLLLKLEQIIHDKRQFGIASGLLFGYKNALDDDLKKAFSTTGGAHVLAVSGLHAGILYGALLFPLGFLGNTRKDKCIRQSITLPLMWAFAFITGLTPSVIRATTMLSLYGLAQIIGKRSFSLNIVGATAFFMLLYNPIYFFDAGFQLSFSAVMAIISINPLLQSLYQPNNYITNYIWSLITVSISAQIGTMPLTIYYFKLFPVAFLLTNLFVIPLVGIILVLLLIYLTFSCLIAIPEFTLYPLHLLLKLFISGIELISKIPYAYIPDIELSINGMISLYLASFWLIMLFVRKKILFAYLLSLLVLFQVIHYL